MLPILLFLSIYILLLSLCGQNFFSVLRENPFFHARAREQKTRRGGGWTDNSRVVGNYKMQLTVILKNSVFEADMTGLLRMKVLLGLLGFGAGLLIKNPVLGLVLLGGLFWLPDAYFRMASVKYAKTVDETIEAAMGIITNSYLQSEDIKSAVTENIDRIDQPLRAVFREFLAETGFVDASVGKAILRMKQKVGNLYFGDWCDILLQCQEDHELKYVLPSIVTKLNAVKRIQTELDAMMLDIYKEFVYVVAIVVLNIPLMALLNADWADILFHTPIGKLAVAFCISVVFAASAYVISVNKALARM